jgi:hypothetical protein
MSVIGRLNMIECQNQREFESFSIGDKVDAKILQVHKDEAKQRIWVEFSRNKRHMAKS